ncbi:MAG: hypothetical protein Ct9H300mP14_07170 [Gammaproteobacteria bacterium]|nr:MAG: hypothetical protein Ct9H300mP14_07170 [Gammaproteobacteria bacterium]
MSWTADVGIRISFSKWGFRLCDLNTPADIVERWTYDRRGKPITIGTVTIVSGDYLIADRDGIVVIPGRL